MRTSITSAALGLKGRLTFGFVAVGLVPLVVLGWYGYQRSVDSVVEGTSARLEEAAVVGGDVIDRNLFERFNDVQAFASNPTALGQRFQRQPVIDGFTASYGVYDLMMIVDSTGMVVATNEVDHTGEPVDVSGVLGLDVSDEEWFRLAVGDEIDGGAHYSDVGVSPYVTAVYGEERLSLAFTAPIHDRFGRVAGAWHNLASFDRIVSGATADIRERFADQGVDSIETQVLRSDGLVLDDADPGAVLELNLVDAGVEAAVAATGAPGDRGAVVGSSGPAGTERIIGYAVTDGALGFPGYSWGVLVSQDTAEAVAAVDGIRSSILFIGLGTLVAVAVIGYLLARSVADPLRRHAEMLAGVADGDLSVRLEARSRHEVGRMAGAINAALVGVGSTMAKVDQTARDLTDSAAGLADLSHRMSETAGSTSNQARGVAASAEQISTTSETVSLAMGQMSESVREISENTSEAARVSAEAVEVTVSTRQRMQALEASASDIGNVVSVITSIAEQTDLLALNATIEAARVGAEGKGFAVVANEVKALASQTSAATGEIQAKIEAIQKDSAAAVQAIADISRLIEKLSEASTTIAGAVEQQSATTLEVTASLGAVTYGTYEISAGIGAVAAAASTATEEAEQTRIAAGRLSELAEHLNEVLAGFRLATGDGDPSGTRAEPSSSSEASPVPVANASSLTGPGFTPAPALAPPRPAPVMTPVSDWPERATPEPRTLWSDLPAPVPSAPATGGTGRLEELDGDLVDRGWH